MITLLHRAVQHDVLPAYARKLLAASSPYNPIARDAVGPGSDRLIEPLSERECEVLRMVAEGLSNNEIAAEHRQVPHREHLQQLRCEEPHRGGRQSTQPGSAPIVALPIDSG